jgi:DNA-binding transcriptional LysR family regulator
MSQQDEVIDLYLLRVFHTLSIERSVTRAGIKLNQSQPAISTALRRLRDITGDMLFVRGRSGMVPTDYGVKLLGPVESALREISRIGAKGNYFDPDQSERTFNIGCPDYLNALFVPSVVAQFRMLAPRAILEFHALGPAFDYEHALEAGDLDVVIGNWPSPPEHLHFSNLFSDEIVCLVSDNHPFASRRVISSDPYLAASHVAPTAYSVSQRGLVDAHLRRERKIRRIAVTLPHFNVVPYVLVNSDLVFTTTRSFADHYVKLLPLAIVDVKLEFPPMVYYQLWHERSHYANEVRWLRSILVKATRKLLPTSSQINRYLSSPDAPLT